MLELLPYLGLALLLGFKHSYDADHLIAVSTFLRRSKSFATSSRISLFWAIGHMVTATIITAVLYYFRESYLASWLGYFEMMVGVMLVALGLWSLRDFFMFHRHEHEHGSGKHVHYHLHFRKSGHRHDHRHMLGIGIVHGLASNDELLILLTAALGVSTFGMILLGIGIFSIGVVLGMLVFSAVFSYPLIKAKSDRIFRYFSLGTGVVSVIYGFTMLLQFL